MAVTERFEKLDGDVALTIQEVSRRSGLSEPTLRYYEKIGLIERVERDESSGHRRYGAAVVNRIDAITYRQLSEIIADRLGPRISGLPITEMSDDQVREAARTVPSLRDAATRVGKIPVIKTDKAGEILGWAPRGVPETIVDTAKSLLALAGTAA